MADTKFGEIAVYEDDDGKAVWEFEGKVQSDIPLDTEAQDFAGAINELKKLSEQEGGEDWQPPDDWLEVPEPGEWEANFLIETRNKSTFILSFYDPQNGYDRYGKITIDWGDGTIETDESWVDEYGFEQSRKNHYEHTYEEPGQYIVKAATDELSCFLAQRTSKNGEILLIAKIGKKIRLAADGRPNITGFFSDCYRLRWIKINSGYKLPVYCFNRCVSLYRLDCAEPLTEIPNDCFTCVQIPQNFDFSQIKKIGQRGFNQANLPKKIFLNKCTEIEKNAFSNCEGVQEVNLPKCLSIGERAFSYMFNIKSFSAPLCTSAGNYSFDSCYALETAEFADDCTFGTNCFYNCYSLYPRPDGSTN